jgi:hypothetical protein
MPHHMDERIIRQLQLLCSVADYDKVVGHEPFFNTWRAGAEYWQLIPNYLVSRCPFCGLAYHADYDTYSIGKTSSYTEFGRHIAEGDHYEHETPHCQHYIANQPFHYLNEFENVNQFGNVFERGSTFSSDAPGMLPHLLLEGTESIAVIHALPICRVENNQFVPRFTKFLVVYFAADRKQIFDPWEIQEDQKAAQDDEYYGALIGGYKVDHDLSAWVRKAKLQWLDLNKSDLPLRSDPIEDFPYNNLVVTPPFDWMEYIRNFPKSKSSSNLSQRSQKTQKLQSKRRGCWDFLFGKR